MNTFGEHNVSPNRAPSHTLNKVFSRDQKRPENTESNPHGRVGGDGNETPSGVTTRRFDFFATVVQFLYPCVWEILGSVSARRSASTHAPKWAPPRGRCLFFLGALFRVLNATLGQLQMKHSHSRCGGSARRWRTPTAVRHRGNCKRLDISERG